MDENKSNGNFPGQSFVVEVKSRENHTWQGTITWVEEKRKENFRSALELIRLMDSAIEETNN